MRGKHFCRGSYDSKPIIITMSWVKSILFCTEREREHKCTMYTAGNRLQMKANLGFFV